ncbi:hypothetical protein QE429_004533 [Bacillus sp. SORGH_AS 510]|nr:hypothetical protein [Bacillus sp. SORGH_AS_0510]MDQ1147706.1 hypothetical protein [Bacillus sp. SORGH_AS_0510]
MKKRENQPSEIKYSIWETKTEENFDQMKEDLAEFIDHSTNDQKPSD